MSDALKLLVGFLLLGFCVVTSASAQVRRERLIVGYADAMADRNYQEAGRQASAAKELTDALTQLGLPPAI